MPRLQGVSAESSASQNTAARLSVYRAVPDRFTGDSTVVMRRLRHAWRWETLFTNVAEVRPPVLLFGVHGLEMPAYAFSASPVAVLQRLITAGKRQQLPPDYSAHNLAELLRRRGADEVVALDLFDPQADLHYDMNLPLPVCEYGKYRTLIDIGSLEHVFDTRQCIDNCIRMLTVRGWYLLHVPVNGYFGHGLHVFNPQAVIDALQLNGFTLRHKSYTTARGHRIRRPGGRGDQLLWLAAEKVAEAEHFTSPQQSYWADFYQEKNPRRQKALQEEYWSSVE